MADEEKRTGLYGQRPSKCADESRRAELERIAKMTGRERAELALRLGRRLRGLGVARRAK